METDEGTISAESDHIRSSPCELNIEVADAQIEDASLGEGVGTSPIKVPELLLVDVATEDSSSSSDLMRPLPDLGGASLQREFETAERGVEITSLDVAPHGCYVFAGCSNGMILLFDMSSNQKSGVLVGHIRAKGLHTNLLLTLRVSEDSRFCFAGVHKGSMEMLALDVSRLPGWGADSGAAPTRKKLAYESLISTSSHLDPKLRGFGAVVRLRNSASCKYVLACGRGIKNVHIWTFAPDAPQGPEWSFVYDVASNGNTIETIGFRDGGRQALSKSAGSIVRVWDLSSSSFETRPAPSSSAGSESSNKETAAETASENEATEGASGVQVASAAEPLDKLPYQDVPNSHDVRCFASNFAFGGTYEFVVVRPDAPGWANREMFELPARCNEDDNGQRRKRQMRQIQDVVATEDGTHLLVLLTDGGVLYFSTELSGGAQSGGGGGAGSAALVEFPTMSRVEGEDSAWALRRVGSRGMVVLLKAHREEDGEGNTLVSISPLTDISPSDIPDTQLPHGTKWNAWDWYYNGAAAAASLASTPTARSSAVSLSDAPEGAASASHGKPPLSSKPAMRKKKTTDTPVGSTPKSSKSPRDLAGSGFHMQTPTLQASPVARYPKISPVEAGEKASNLDDEERQARRRNKAKQRLEALESSGSHEVMHTPLKRARLDAGTPRGAGAVTQEGEGAAVATVRVDREAAIKLLRTPIPTFEARKRGSISTDIITPPNDPVLARRIDSFREFCNSWEKNQSALAAGTSSVFRVVRAASSNSGTETHHNAESLTVADLAAVQRVVAHCIREQRSLQLQYISEVRRVAALTFDAAVRQKSESLSFVNLSSLNVKYASSLEELLSRQRLDIRAVASGTAEGRVEAYHLQQTCLGETVLVRSLPLYPRVFSVDEMRGAVDQLMHQSCAIFAQ